MSAQIKCSSTTCPNMVPYRPREEIAAGLRNTIASCSTSPTDWSQRFRSLSAHLYWLEAELMSLCPDCTLTRAAQLRAEAVEQEFLAAGDPDPLPANVVRMRPGLGFPRRTLVEPKGGG